MNTFIPDSTKQTKKSLRHDGSRILDGHKQIKSLKSLFALFQKSKFEKRKQQFWDIVHKAGS